MYVICHDIETKLDSSISYVGRGRGGTLIITKYKVTMDTKTSLGHRVTVWDLAVPRMPGKV